MVAALLCWIEWRTGPGILKAVAALAASSRAGLNPGFVSYWGGRLGGLVIEKAGSVALSGETTAADATVDAGSMTIGSVTPVAGEVKFDGAVNVAGAVEINTDGLSVEDVLNRK